MGGCGKGWWERASPAGRSCERQRWEEKVMCLGNMVPQGRVGIETSGDSGCQRSCVSPGEAKTIPKSTHCWVTTDKISVDQESPGGHSIADQLMQPQGWWWKPTRQATKSQPSKPLKVKFQSALRKAPLCTASSRRP